MKKLFFFKSSSSNSGNSQPPPPIDKEVNWENTLENRFRDQTSDKAENSLQSSDRLFSRVQKSTHENHKFATDPCLRRSLSFSSLAFSDNDGVEQRRSFCSSNENISPSCCSSNIPQRFNHSSQCCSPTPGKQMKARSNETAASEHTYQSEKPKSACLCNAHNDSLQNSSSSNVPNSVLDLYIDGERQQERSKSKNTSAKINHSAGGNGNGSKGLPPRVQYTAPTSPIDDARGSSRSRSFRDSSGRRSYFSSTDWTENGSRREPHHKLAKHVMEKLSQSHASTKTNTKDLDTDTPIMIEEIHGKASHRRSGTPSQVTHKKFPLDEPAGFHKENFIPEKDLYAVENRDDVSEELQKKFKDARERFFVLSTELEQENFLQDTALDVSSLVQKIRFLTEDRISLALEVSSALQGQIEDRAFVKENLRLTKLDLASQTQRLEKEKNELQAALEKELDRRSSEWSVKLEKYQLEEQRLRERVRELAEQNVSLQRLVSSFNDKEAESRNTIAHSESELRDRTSKLEELKHEKRDLQHNFSCLQEKYLVAESERGSIQRNCKEKEMESQDLQKSVKILHRTCTEQEKTICGLREVLCEKVENQSYEKLDRHVGKLQMEHMRLTGVEQALRREVQSYKSEADSLRDENINLLNRLKLNGNDCGFSTFKLDQELCDRVCCLQKQGLLLLNECTQLCSKLLDFIKGKSGYIPEAGCFEEATLGGLDRQFVVESDAKVQGFKRGTQNLMRSLETVSSLLQEKSKMIMQIESGNADNYNSEETVGLELKAESLVTNALRDKILSQELSCEQLQAELAAAVRGNGILRCEIQNAMDTLSSTTHKLKNLELEMMKKDEKIILIENDFQELTKELARTRGILPKLSLERDLMWEEVKQCSEKEMLLNSEVNMLKKRIEVLDEDVMLKEGQIAILKDSLGNKTFGLLSSPERTLDFEM